MRNKHINVEKMLRLEPGLLSAFGKELLCLAAFESWRF